MDNKRMLDWLAERPALYAPSTSAFWDDTHISKAMLAAHLDPELDAASRRASFIDRSAAWIAARAGGRGARVLDLGCGPGLYCERFARAGLEATGVDLSPRSIACAIERAKLSGLDARYIRGDYLRVDFGGGYDAAIIIYCDFGVLPPDARAALLGKARAALKPGGRLILDAHTRCRDGERRASEYCDGGFWSPDRYLLVTTHYDYPDTRNYVDQYVVMTDYGCECYNIWNQLYDGRSLAAELEAAGFRDVKLYGDAAGAPPEPDGDTICAEAFA